MPIAGATDTARVDLAVYGPDTTAVLRVPRPDTGAWSEYVADPVPGSDNAAWTAVVGYPVPGVYEHHWHVSGTGYGVQVLRVAVGPAGTADGRHTYATTTDLANALDEAPPLDAERRLRDATASIDDLLLCARYDVDSDGMPTAPTVITALRDAVCALVKWRLDIGDDTGAGDVFTSTAIAGVSLARRTTAPGQADNSRYGPAVGPILAAAGLLAAGESTAPMVY